MPQAHQQTKHSYLSVRKDPNYLDFATQPSKLKFYPHFYRRYLLSEVEGLRSLEWVGKLAHEVKYPNGSYFLRTVPSAGALYPIEVYFHIRKVKGVPSGLYHYEPSDGVITLLYEYVDDGVEALFETPHQRNGVIAFVTANYFRSSWKYRNRAIRYLFLDAGHMVANLEAVMQLEGVNPTLHNGVDYQHFNDLLGFEGYELLIGVVDGSTLQEREVKPLRQKIPFVAGCDYLERNTFVEQAYVETLPTTKSELDLSLLKPEAFDDLKGVMIERRSIRAFYQKAIEKEEYETIFDGLFELASAHKIEIYYTVHNINGIENGCYLYSKAIKLGDFAEKSRYLSLEQAIGGQSAMTLYFTSAEVENYQWVNILSGYLAGVIYLRAINLGIGVSGIGAYYDDEVKSFLETKNNILYLLAVGR
jgi:SagB-type dehydrogenase family enzyme